MDKNKYYRCIPKVDVLLDMEEIKCLIETYGREPVMDAIRTVTETVRQCIHDCENASYIEAQIEGLVCLIEECLLQMYKHNIRRVINATGTILHTNLGRAPIGNEHMQYVSEVATGYSNLEYDLDKGKRGERYSHFQELLCKITGAEAAMAVNNNAAAVLLVLNSLAKGGEVIVSRGELVEIGGKFRIPDVMELSRAKLLEVGTTNKTHLRDYVEAVNENTKAFLKVHTSNYKIVGFTESVSLEELMDLKKQYALPVIEDIGSGVLINLEKYGLSYEPTVQESIQNGADVVTFSGDKLLGGPQAGLIVGKKKYIDIMKKNPLTRALRIDKFTATALEGVLTEYLSEDKAVQNIPTLAMITKPYQELEKKAQDFYEKLLEADLPATISLEDCESQVGGGSLPMERIKSRAVVIKPMEISVSSFEERLRRLPVPVVARVEKDAVWFDLRTLLDMYDIVAAMIVQHNLLEKNCLLEGKAQ